MAKTGSKRRENTGEFPGLSISVNIAISVLILAVFIFISQPFLVSSDTEPWKHIVLMASEVCIMVATILRLYTLCSDSYLAGCESFQNLSSVKSAMEKASMADLYFDELRMVLKLNKEQREDFQGFLDYKGISVEEFDSYLKQWDSTENKEGLL